MKLTSPFFELTSDRLDSFSNIDEPTSTVSVRSRFTIIFGGFLISMLTCWLAFNVFTNGIVHFTTSEQSILFISDIHLDPQFNNRSNWSVWCHKTDPSLQTTFRFGRYGCDTPEDLLDSLISNLPRLVYRPTVIVFGGDYGAVPSHSPPEFFIPIFQNIRSKISRIFPDSPIMPILGNSEFSPNYGSWHNDTVNYLNAARSWEGLILPFENETLIKGGYYYRDYDRVRIIILNTVMYHVYRDAINDSDPYDQFVWLENVCESAVKRNLELVVFFHVPPSISTRDRFPYQGWYPTYVDKFAAIYYKYRFAMICGHLHIDALMPLFNHDGLHGGYIFSVPAISLRHDNNPAFRLFKLKNGKLVDYIQYWADIIDNPKGSLEWKFQYSFREVYGAKDLSEMEVYEVAEKILNNASLMWKYRELMYVENYNKRSAHKCMLISLSRDDLEKCLKESV